VLGAAALVLATVAGFNALVDPWWFFPHDLPLNRVQEDIDERAQKTNWLQARAGSFDSVLLGSSRTTYIDRGSFAPAVVMNYAVNAKLPREYLPYLRHFAAANGKVPAMVYMGVDFFTSRARPVFDVRPPEFYFARVGDLRYEIGALLSLETTGYALRSFGASTGLWPIQRPERYDRDDVRYFGRPITDAMRQRNLLRTLEQYRTQVYGPGFAYDAGLPAVWSELRAAFPATRFVVFTTPESAPLFSLMVQLGRLPDHERWLTDLAAAFGEVWDFTGLNSVTTDQANYLDAHHFTPRVGGLIVDRLLGRPLPPGHADFGRLVTGAGIAAHLADLRAHLRRVDPDPIRTARERARVVGPVPNT
jgi:hypothetical protein